MCESVRGVPGISGTWSVKNLTSVVFTAQFLQVFVFVFVFPARASGNLLNVCLRPVCVEGNWVGDLTLLTNQSMYQIYLAEQDELTFVGFGKILYELSNSL